MSSYYDLNEELIGFHYNGNDYFYGKDCTGIIRYIYDENGDIVVTYEYDAWGRQLSVTGTEANTTGQANPYRYKDYYFDEETEFYYLQSRYYDPNVGRFISPDSIDYLGASGTTQSWNLFAYCENNPVNDSDPSGHLAQAIVGGILSGILAFAIYYLEYLLGMRNWDWAAMVAIILVNAAIGAATWFLGLGGWMQKFTRLYGVAHKILKAGKHANAIIKAITWIASDTKFLINSVIKTATRKSGESWFSAIKRFLNINFAVSI